MLAPVLLLLLNPAAAEAGTADRPDIVFVLSDDHRNDFLSSAGHPFLRTPHIDALADRGVRFRNAFVTTSICAASRATILTGLYEKTHQFTFKTPPLQKKYAEDSYPALLKKAGYRTGFVGKFGMQVVGGGVNEGGGPDTLLFDEATVIGRNPYFKLRPDGTLRHEADLCGDAGIKFIEETPAGQPLCLSVSFNSAHAEDSDKKRHYPYPFAEAGLYDNADVPEPLIERDFHKQLPRFFNEGFMHRDRYAWRWDTPEKYRHNYINYCRLLSGMDRNVGRVVEALEVAGRLENAVVIFMGDNGYYAGSRGFAGKWSHYEESLRVPMVACDFRTPQQGRVPEAVVLNVDIAPTILDYAGVPKPERYQGFSLRPLIEDAAASPLRQEFFIEHRMDHDPIPQYEGVRGPRFKYARYYQFPNEPNGGEFLHDLQSDPQERRNLAGDPAFAAELSRMRSLTGDISGQYDEARE